ncbi:MAG: hypothetical protein K8R23_17120 [Chthoniobacter sp.]|nr:hypothetical protein [Chthoniobacter sp.]
MKTLHMLLPLVASCFLLGCSSPPSSPTTAHTPGKGSPERAAIVAEVKAAMAKLDKKPVVLVVANLKVHDGWAWIQVNPQSPDGKQHYESQSALLQEKAKKWTLQEWMPAEDGTDYKAYFKNVRNKYPAAPADIFPQ